MVELSIVLVIIGLLIGGILVAQSMIGTAKIQKQIRQFQQFDIAVTNFKTKFNQIPGACNLCAHPSQPTGSGAPYLTDYLGGSSTPQFLYIEGFFFFYDLSNLQMISDNYTGNDCQAGIGHSWPAAAIGNGAIVVNTNNAGDIYWATALEGEFPNPWSATNCGSNWAVPMFTGNMTPAQALAIDTKMDDGNATTGNVVAVQQRGNDRDSMPQGSGSIVPFNLDIAAVQSPAYCTNASNNYNVSQNDNTLCNLAVKSNYRGDGAASH